MLLYADDIVLLAESQDELQSLVGRVDLYMRHWGLSLNISKSFAMYVRNHIPTHAEQAAFNQAASDGTGEAEEDDGVVDDDSMDANQPISVAGQVLRWAKMFRYLGVRTTVTGDCTLAFRSRSKLVKQEFSRLQRAGVLESGLTARTAATLVTAICDPHFTFWLSSVWAPRHVLKAASHQMFTMYRQVLGCDDGVSRAFVYHELGVMPFEYRLHALRAGFFGRLVLNSAHQPGGGILRAIFSSRWASVVAMSDRQRARSRSACSLLWQSLTTLGLLGDFQRILALNVVAGSSAHLDEQRRWDEAVYQGSRAHALRQMATAMADNARLCEDLLPELGGARVLTHHTGLWRCAPYVRNSASRAPVRTRAALRSGHHTLRVNKGRNEVLTDAERPRLPPAEVGRRNPPRAWRTCLLCNEPAVETVDHFLHDCAHPDIARCRRDMLPEIVQHLATVLQCHPDVARAHWADLPRSPQAWLLLGVLPVQWMPLLRIQLTDGPAPSIPDSQLARYLSHRTLPFECHQALRAMDTACLRGVHAMMLARNAADPKLADRRAQVQARSRTGAPSQRGVAAPTAVPVRAVPVERGHF